MEADFNPAPDARGYWLPQPVHWKGELPGQESYSSHRGDPHTSKTAACGARKAHDACRKRHERVSDRIRSSVTDPKGRLCPIPFRLILKALGPYYHEPFYI